MLGDENISHDINANDKPFGSLSKATAGDEHDFLDTSTGIPRVKENGVCPPGTYGLECQTQCPVECSRDCDHTTGNCFIYIGMK